MTPNDIALKDIAEILVTFRDSDGNKMEIYILSKLPNGVMFVWVPDYQCFDICVPRGKEQ